MLLRKRSYKTIQSYSCCKVNSLEDIYQDMFDREISKQDYKKYSSKDSKNKALFITSGLKFRKQNSIKTS